VSLWNKFKESLSGIRSESFSSRLHQKINESFPQYEEDFHLKAACLSGLMARVAYADMNICTKEEQIITHSLKTWLEMSEEDSLRLAKLCLDEVKDLAGVENHLYCLPLRETLPEEERFKILETLFAIAAADENIENHENEEIRNIQKGLLLEHHHFVAARAQVIKYLGSLKS
jgi:uncharacterized tellurite resistance protein B-like protein